MIPNIKHVSYYTLEKEALFLMDNTSSEISIKSAAMTDGPNVYY